MPKNSLQGHSTDTGWRIIRQINTELGSGGNFCARYEVQSPCGEKIGFMKAMDLAGGGSLREIQEKINTYIFEQDILELCKGKKMTRVVTPIEVGQIRCNNFPAEYNTVYYAIFDMAQGDLRSTHLNCEKQNKDWEAIFRGLHHAAIGIQQLHNEEIAHQDIKPSNILAFNPKSFKVSDLGRVVDKKGVSPFREYLFPGDQGYKPIEMFYGITMFEFTDRLSCDMYMIGSLIYHMIEEVQIGYATLQEADELHSRVRTLSFNEALPFLVTAFNRKMESFKKVCTNLFGEKAADAIYTTVKEMCHPNPKQRGNRKYNNEYAIFSMEKYISKLSQTIALIKLEKK